MAGLTPLPTHGFAVPNSSHKNNLRLSSSLQDFSAYHRLDTHEAVEFKLPHDRKHPHLLQRENGASSFSKEKALGLSGSSKFYVVLDCGSTGTRVHVFQASIDHTKEGGLPIVLKSFTEGASRKASLQRGRAYDRMETEPGFDKLVHNISGLNNAIRPLIWWAEKQIPVHAYKRTSLFLYATAGVRRLPSADSKWLLDNAWSILKKSPFSCQREWVKIISGTEEAYYGWIALNYHTGMLGSWPKKETFGALDMGGSSLQVTFESKEQLHNETDLKLRIGSVDHNLNAYSLSGYGLNDAFDKSVVNLLKRLPGVTDNVLINGNVEIKHPCLQHGYKEQYKCSQCASNLHESVSPAIGGRNLGKGGKVGISVWLIGAPNWEECSALAKIAVNLSEWSNQSPGFDCDLQPCALPHGLARPYGQFYAMSGFFVVYRFFNLTSEAALDDVLEKGRDFCEKTWEFAKNSVAPQPFIEQYCFRAPYIVLLLREGLHITDDQIIIGSGSITWTLGVALLEAGRVLSTRLGVHSYEIFQMKINPLVLIVILLISLILLVCALSCVGKWMPGIFRRPYLPLFRPNSASATSVLSIPSPFSFQRWSPINTGDGRVKMPLSPTVAGSQHRPFGLGNGLSGSGIQLMDSSLYPSTSSVSHSYSSNSLGQMFDSGSMGSFWSPHRSQMQLQSRRSQSREDLNSSLAEAHMVKV
ncbi:putative adenosine diphosphatase [Tripterygium wilfordii]|uniref:Putative adenosine diphosphatase n=1 Tax=Tripterygium wilfordii TaxID=458696 RepID=A0A7J7BVT1_TRIWF|nr:putative adenosine diphosphatase [Tripterygium wilfordii]